MSTQNAVQLADEALLASMGYKQEFKRAFTPLEVAAFRILCEEWVLTPELFSPPGVWDSIFHHRPSSVNCLCPFLCLA